MLVLLPLERRRPNEKTSFCRVFKKLASRLRPDSFNHVRWFTVGERLTLSGMPKQAHSSPQATRAVLSDSTCRQVGSCGGGFSHESLNPCEQILCRPIVSWKGSETALREGTNQRHLPKLTNINSGPWNSRTSRSDVPGSRPPSVP